MVNKSGNYCSPELRNQKLRCNSDYEFSFNSSKSLTNIVQAICNLEVLLDSVIYHSETSSWGTRSRLKVSNWWPIKFSVPAFSTNFDITTLWFWPWLNFLWPYFSKTGTFFSCWVYSLYKMLFSTGLVNDFM